jgi:predicted CoA-substrate-specific enzyme activase
VIVLGLDIGSRSVGAVWLAENRTVQSSAVLDAGFDPASVTRSLVSRGGHDRIVVTGYGRHVAREALGCSAVTEIKAHALGASHLHPQAKAVLDIGGQDTKVIALSENGRVSDFEMNDKCAAGTGRFLEVMARALGFSLDDFASASLEAERSVAVTSMCTVFAESEVTGLMHRGEERAAIARGLHEAIARRTLSTLARVVGDASPLVFAGGVARNRAMVHLVAQGFPGQVIVAENPQTVGALGAALSALDG